MIQGKGNSDERSNTFAMEIHFSLQSKLIVGRLFRGVWAGPAKYIKITEFNHRKMISFLRHHGTIVIKIRSLNRYFVLCIVR